MPSPRVKGSVSTPASVTAPRTPARVVAATSCQLGRVTAIPRRAARASVRRSDNQTQAKRKVASVALIASM